MILDTLANASTYAGLHKNFGVAFEYLKATDLDAIEVGTYEVAEGVKVIVSDKPGVTAEVAAEKFECHNKNIDIQLCISGVETMGWKARNECESVKTEYNDTKDVMFYNDAPTTYFTLKGGEFTIFYPNDVHSPMIGTDKIKKAVVKVAI
jgi:YhcH/YjgK/YiaL family protein